MIFLINDAFKEPFQLPVIIVPRDAVEEISFVAAIVTWIPRKTIIMV